MEDSYEETIECLDPAGKLTPVDAGEITFRPAAYGILIDNNRVVLQRHPQTDLWHPPGLILEPNQTPAQALSAHFRTLLQLNPVLGQLLFTEEQYRLDEEGRAWHLAIFYHALERSTGALSLPASTGMAGAPEWVPLPEVSRQKMQFGYAALQAARNRGGPHTSEWS